MGESYPFKRFSSQNGESNGLGFSANGNSKNPRSPLKYRSNSGRTNGVSVMKAVESQLWKLLILCVVIVYFLAYTMLEDTMKMPQKRAEEDSFGQTPTLLEPQPNLPELKIETQVHKFVPHKLLQKFRERHGETNFSSTNMERKKRIPIRPPSVALVCADLSRSSSNLLPISVAKGLQALGYILEALDLYPNNGTNRSLCWIRLGQPEQALPDAKSCRQLRPDWPKACYREGAALRLLQRFDEAANAFYEGVKLDPENKELVDAFREAVEAGRKFHCKK